MIENTQHAGGEWAPIVRRPRAPSPVVVSVPHYGTQALPEVRDADYADPAYLRYPRGYADAFAAELYGELHAAGATVIASPYSRLFVDLNRRRDDFDVVDGAVYSARGVVRTHIGDGRALYARPLTPNTAEERLVRYYDPYHAELDALTRDALERFGRAVLLDAHTASEKGLGQHEVVIGTRRGQTAGGRLRGSVERAFRGAGFDVQHDVPGYAGAHTVCRHGGGDGAALQAVQIEVNSGLLLGTTRREYFERIDRGEPAPVNARNVERVRSGLARLLDELTREVVTPV